MKEIAHAYLQAWNSHDGNKVAALFAPQGHYYDPNVPHGISGPALAGYVNGLTSAFPDLKFVAGPVLETRDGPVVAEWTMTGTNSGPMRGMPPTGRQISLPGIDVIEADDAGIRSVRGYFNSSTMLEQLDLQVIVQPKAIGPVTFGYAAYTSLGNRARPAVLGTTRIALKSAEDLPRLQALSRAMLQEIAGQPGYIGTISAVTSGNTGFTVTAWDSMEAARAATQSPAHGEAMRAFYEKDGLGISASTTLWSEARHNTRWTRCTECGAMASAENGEPCGCGAAGPEPSVFF